MASSRPSSLLSSLLPRDIATAEFKGVANPAHLLPGESAILGSVAPWRRREFAAGRLCARRAVERFGFSDYIVGSHEDRRPRWPEPLTGSITHTGGFSAAVAGERRKFHAIGIDAEMIGRMSNEVWAHVLVATERKWLDSLDPSTQMRAATLMFSAKEAFYKCQYQVTQQWLEFKDVAVELASGSLDAGSLVVRPLGRVRLFEKGHSPLVIRFVVCDGLVLTATTIAVRGQ